MRQKLRLPVLFAVVATMLFSCLAGCGGGSQHVNEKRSREVQTDSSSRRTREGADVEESDEETNSEATEDLDEATQGLKSTFIGEQFYKGKVNDAVDALDALRSVFSRIGADDTTNFEFVVTSPDRFGMTYYTFQQRVGDMPVFAAKAKVLVDDDGDVAGVVSSLLPQAPLAGPDEWACSQEQAETAVREECTRQSKGEVRVVEDAAEQVVIPFSMGEDRYSFAWVVYVQDVSEDVDMAYVAHFVSEDGAYLCGIRVAEPGDADVNEMGAALFDFGRYESNTWTGEVAFRDGHTEEVTVPVLLERASGEIILGDAERRILCADFADWMYGDALTWRVAEGEDGDFDNDELIAYCNFIRIWDFYDELGWTGPDGVGTPSLLLMGLEDASGASFGDAYYLGREGGCQTFAFNVHSGVGECIDLLGHAFAHCLTSTSMDGNLFLNEYGAVDEGICDVLGNLNEMLLEDAAGGAWAMGENSSDGASRFLLDPELTGRPSSVGDGYYVPTVQIGTAANDYGGARINASLLGVISNKLYQADMDESGQVKMWLDAALAMTPHTDFAQMKEILQWSIWQAGYSRYEDALSEALEETRLGESTTQHEASEGFGIIGFTYPDAAIADVGEVRVSFANVAGGEPVQTWPDAESHRVSASLPRGDYRVAIECFEEDVVTKGFVYTDLGWRQVDDGTAPLSAPDAAICHVEEGATLPLSTNGLEAAADEGDEAS